MRLRLSERHIDHGFYRITGREAFALAGEVQRKVPRWGYELRVDVNGCPAWLTRTPVAGHWTWAVYGRDLVNIR